MNIREACNKWVTSEMSAIPMSVVEKLYDCGHYNDITEITPPAIGDRVFVYDEDEYGTIVDYINEAYIVRLDNNFDEDGVKTDGVKTIIASTIDEINNLEVQRYEHFPMWGTMWAFESNWDNDWLEENIQTMANCGFRIYESEDYRYIFGIDGAGYDFYEEHWIPLYKAMGLHWHDIENVTMGKIKIKAKREIAYDEEEYGVDFIEGKIYNATKDPDGSCYVSDTESGSGVWLSPEDLENDFEVIDVL